MSKRILIVFIVLIINSSIWGSDIDGYNLLDSYTSDDLIGENIYEITNAKKILISKTKYIYDKKILKRLIINKYSSVSQSMNVFQYVYYYNNDNNVLFIKNEKTNETVVQYIYKKDLLVAKKYYNLTCSKDGKLCNITENYICNKYGIIERIDFVYEDVLTNDKICGFNRIKYKYNSSSKKYNLVSYSIRFMNDRYGEYFYLKKVKSENNKLQEINYGHL